MKKELGILDVSSDVLKPTKIGLWAFELDEGKEPRMYVNKVMLELIGLKDYISPEETYHAWYDNVDKDSYPLVHKSVEKMIAGEHSEVQYPWHYPNGKTIYVRCGAVRDYSYTKGIRVKGTHQDVTNLIHFQNSFSKLGTIDLSSDILRKAKIGLWAFEFDEGTEPRMYVDDAMLELIGLKEQISPEKTYHAWYDYIDKNSYPLVNNSVEKMIAGEHAEVQYPWHHPNGHVMYVRCGGVRNFSYTKGIRIEGTHQNVTEVIHFQEKDIVSKTMTLFEKIQAIYSVDLVTKEYKVFTSSDNFKKENVDTLYNKNNFFDDLKVNVEQVIFDKDKDMILKILAIENIENNLKENVPFSINYRLMIDNEPKWFNLEVIKTLENGKPHLLIGVFNINEQRLKELEQQNKLEEALNMAQASSKAKTSFLFNMSHDIRTPMNAITGYTMLAKQNINDSKQISDYLNKIDISSKQLLALINQVLEMSRIESGKIILNKEHTDIKQNGNAVMASIQIHAKNKGIKFEYDDSKVKHSSVLTDTTRINQIMFNIIGNAIKYTENNGTIKFSIEEKEYDKQGYGLYIFTISDTGIGISEDFIKHIYDEFSREQTSTVSHIQGTGLGMSIVKKLVDLMQGTIDIESKKNVGTKVIISIPICIDTEQISQEINFNDKISFKGMKVLLVEDNDMNREIATKILENNGFIVDIAEDGDIAIEKIKNSKTGDFDIVLMDIQMPRVNGFEATKAIRKLENIELANIPIIAMTANAFEEDKEAAIQAGMNAHIAKPINIDNMKLILAQFLKHK